MITKADSKFIAFNFIETLNHLGLLHFDTLDVLGFDKFVLRYRVKSGN